MQDLRGDQQQAGVTGEACDRAGRRIGGAPWSGLSPPAARSTLPTRRRPVAGSGNRGEPGLDRDPSGRTSRLNPAAVPLGIDRRQPPRSGPGDASRRATGEATIWRPHHRQTSPLGSPSGTPQPPPGRRGDRPAVRRPRNKPAPGPGHTTAMPGPPRPLACRCCRHHHHQGQTSRWRWGRAAEPGNGAGRVPQPPRLLSRQGSAWRERQPASPPPAAPPPKPALALALALVDLTGTVPTPLREQGCSDRPRAERDARRHGRLHSAPRQVGSDAGPRGRNRSAGLRASAGKVCPGLAGRPGQRGWRPPYGIHTPQRQQADGTGGGDPRASRRPR